MPAVIPLVQDGGKLEPAVATSHGFLGGHRYVVSHDENTRGAGLPLPGGQKLQVPSINSYSRLEESGG